MNLKKISTIYTESVSKLMETDLIQTMQKVGGDTAGNTHNLDHDTGRNICEDAPGIALG